VRLTLIVNPIAGRGKARRVFPSVARCLDRHRVDFRTLFTEGPGHATELARGASSDGSDAVVACGGDGTLHEVINGRLGDGPVGIIPCGSGDDLAVNAGIPRDPRRPAGPGRGEGAAVRPRPDRRPGLRLHRRRRLRLDGHPGGEPPDRLLRGRAVYLSALVRTLARFRPVELRLEGDGFAWQGRAMFAVAANAPSYGAGMRIAPLARMDDGLLDVVVVEEMPKAELLRVFPRVYSGRHLQHPRLRHFRTRRVRIASSQPLDLYADGEYGRPLPAKSKRSPPPPLIVPATPATARR